VYVPTQPGAGRARRTSSRIRRSGQAFSPQSLSRCKVHPAQPPSPDYAPGTTSRTSPLSMAERADDPLIRIMQLFVAGAGWCRSPRYAALVNGLTGYRRTLNKAESLPARPERPPTSPAGTAPGRSGPGPRPATRPRRTPPAATTSSAPPATAGGAGTPARACAPQHSTNSPQPARTAHETAPATRHGHPQRHPRVLHLEYHVVGADARPPGGGVIPPGSSGPARGSSSGPGDALACPGGENLGLRCTTRARGCACSVRCPGFR